MWTQEQSDFRSTMFIREASNSSRQTTKEADFCCDRPIRVNGVIAISYLHVAM